MGKTPWQATYMMKDYEISIYLSKLLLWYLHYLEK